VCDDTGLTCTEPHTASQGSRVWRAWRGAARCGEAGAGHQVAVHPATALTKAVLQAAAADRGALAELWDIMHEEALASTRSRALASEPANHHDVLDICKRMWGSTEARHLYATHRLLREDSVYFYRLKTRPPTYHVRSRAEVDRMLRQQQHVRCVF
jgi:hypothetical protein